MSLKKRSLSPPATAIKKMKMSTNDRDEGVSLSTADTDDEMTIIERREELHQISDKKTVRLFFSSDGTRQCQLLKINDDGTEVGLTLDATTQASNLVKLFPKLEESFIAMTNKGEKAQVRLCIDDDVYASVNWRFPCMDIRAFYTDKEGRVKPTRRGVAYNLAEARKLITVLKQASSSENDSDDDSQLIII